MKKIFFLLFFIPFMISGQRYISGRITDGADGEPIVSATVYFTNTNIVPLLILRVINGSGYQRKEAIALRFHILDTKLLSKILHRERPPWFLTQPCRYRNWKMWRYLHASGFVEVISTFFA